ncbi:hypothetical protein H7Y63_02640 [Polaromonas sp.]|nr:hypothetical protein [Candidatus Saccharibacteria bacterium]
MSVEVLAGSASAAAYVVGQAAHYVMSSKAHQESEPLIAQLDAPFRMETDSELQAEHNQKANVAKRAFATILAADALLLTVTVGTGILGWNPDSDTRVKPTLEIAVDHSGQTSHPREGEPTIGAINDVLGQFDGKRAHVRTFVSRLGVVEETSRLDSVIKETNTIGASDLETATKRSLDATTDIYAVNGPGGRKRSTAVVVITNGQSVGDPNTLIPQANLDKTPIYVVNVPSKTSRPETIEGLKATAAATGGQYWEVTDKMPDVAKTVENSVTGYVSKGSESGNKRLLKIFSLLTGLGTAAAFSKTRYPLPGSSSKAVKAN